MTRPPRPTPLPLHAGRSRILAVARSLAAALGLLTLMVGVPWGLTAAVGTPWPSPATSFADLVARLGQPISDPLMLQLLALIGWTCWGAFLVSVVREVAWTVQEWGALRHDRTRFRAHLHDLPVHRAAAALLVGTLLLSWASAWHPADRTPATVPTRVSAQLVADVAQPVEAKPAARQADAAEPPGLAPAIATVPYTVVDGDTLWDIARAHLGDPLRWPKIYQLNHGRPQADGQCLSDPDTIRPGWILHLPAATSTDTAPPRRAPSSQTSNPHLAGTPTKAGVPGSPGEPRSTQPGTARHGTPVERAHREQRPVRIGVGAASAIGITTAIGIAAAVAFARAHARRRRQPDLDGPAPKPLTQTVRAANSAHLTLRQATATPEPDGDPTLAVRRAAPAEPGAPGAVVCASRDGQELPLDALALPGGIALSGPGADASARALAVAVLSAAQTVRPAPPTVRLLVPAATARRLFPGHAYDLPGWATTADCEEALNLMERERLHRLRLTTDSDKASEVHPAPPMDLFICDLDPASRQRLQSVAAHAAPGKLGLVLLGADAWDTTAHVSADGTVTATSGPGAETLRDACMFTLAPAPARDLLDVLYAAHGRVPGTQPAPPPPQPTVQAAPLVPETRRPIPVTSPEPSPRPKKLSNGTSEENTTAAEAAQDEDEPPEPGPEQEPTGRPLTVHLLGGFRISRRENDEEFGSGLREQAREFIALLAAHPRGMRDEEIAEHLRLSSDPEQAHRDLGNLRRAIRRSFRQATGAHQAAFLVRTGDRFRLDPTLIATDVEAFTTALQRAATAPNDRSRAAALKTATALYTGPLCDGADYPWADELREALHRKAVDALVLLADHTASGRTDPDEALALLDKAAEWDPFNEAIYQRIIRLQRTAGRDDAAHRTYALLKRRLADIDVDPDPATTAMLRRQGLSTAAR